ncbi:MAG: class I SAM-dependent methyltransferase [Pseudomonadota bacterium]
MTDLGWNHSAHAWIARQGEAGDVTRVHALDAPMLAHLPASGRALDIGCGEGRFCRMMRARGLDPTGLDITPALIAAAKAKDPDGTYVEASAESLPFDDATFDVAVFYLSLIDIPDFRAAIAEAARILKPGAPLLIANLTETVTARPRGWNHEGSHWVSDGDVLRYIAVDDIPLERPVVCAWDNIRIENYHRPLSAYMTALLAAGLTLTAFQNPPYTGPDSSSKEKFNRVPWAFFMAWAKPE